MSVEIIVVASVAVQVPRRVAEIIVPVDPESADHRALGVARRLAVASGGHLTLLAVADPDDAIPDEWRTGLHELAGTLGTARVGAKIVRSGSVADGIVSAADDLSTAVVCMSADAAGRWRDAFDLSSSSAVVHHVHCPVVLVGPEARVPAIEDDDPIEELVAFVDTSELADSVVEAAVEWADVLGARLWIVEVIDPSLSVGSDDLRDSTYVARLAAKHGREGVDIEWEVLRGKDPATEIARFLGDDHPLALAILGSHGRSGWAELRLGSTCMKVARDASVPVVVMPVGRGQKAVR